LTALVGIVAVAVVFSGAWIALQGQGADTKPTGPAPTTPVAIPATPVSSAEATAPTAETAGAVPGDALTAQVSVIDDAVVFGSAQAPVTVDVFQDYMCPACGRFEQTNAADLRAVIDSGRVRLRIHPLTFLDGTSMGSRYSTRAANALLEVAKAAPEAAWALNAALFGNQPEEGTTGLSDERIAALAVTAGAPSAVTAAFAELREDQWLRQTMARDFEEQGIQSTPTVKIDGVVFEGRLFTPGELRKAIEVAAND
jgi:protein-disulfide isomerase